MQEPEAAQVCCAFVVSYPLSTSMHAKQDAAQLCQLVTNLLLHISWKLAWLQYSTSHKQAALSSKSCMQSGEEVLSSWAAGACPSALRYNRPQRATQDTAPSAVNRRLLMP